MSIKVLHIADPHVDSPLKGLSKYPGLPRDEIRTATRRAFSNAVSFAIHESVDLVLIAGDLFDGAWRDMGTGLWAVDQFVRLRDADIRVGLIRGNHDALSKVAPTLRWPDNVFEFGADAAGTWILEDIGIAIHGQSFANQVESRDLAANYPKKLDGLTNVGLLHTSLAGSPDHDTYAPTSIETLQSKQYDYWALGHIHQRATFGESATIAFSGNLQGRHIREHGPKGAVLLEFSEVNLKQTFQAFDVVRWHQCDYRVHEDDGIDDILSGVELELAKCRLASDERPSAIRVEVTGTAGCHDDLAGVGRSAEFAAAVRSLAREHDDVWIEQVRVRTVPPVDIDSIRRSDGLLSAVFDEFASLQTDPDSLSDWDIATLFKPLENQCLKRDVSLDACDIQLSSIADQRRWLAEAEAVLLSTLADPSEAGELESN